MGFGTLFIGVFLLLNLSFFGFTDLLSGVVMLMAFYKLRGINRYFKAAIIPTGVFCAVGLTEFIQEIAYLFGGGFDELIDYLHPVRLLIIGAVLILLHLGICDVAKEVDIRKTAKGAKVCAILCYPVLIIGATERIAYLIFGNLLALVIIRIISLFFLLALLVATLITVYSAYMNICMPGEENKEYVEKPSKFEFINRFRKRQEEKNREYAEYRLGQMKKRVDRYKEKKNKKSKK